MNYEILKIFHLFFLVMFVASSTVLLLEKPGSLFLKWFSGIAGFFVFVFGYGLMHARGYSFENWLMAKFFILLAITGSMHFVTKRKPKWARKLMVAHGVLLLLAIILAVIKRL